MQNLSLSVAPPTASLSWNRIKDAHMENCVLLNSVQEFIETEAWLLPNNHLLVFKTYLEDAFNTSSA